LWDNDNGGVFENPDVPNQYIGYEYNFEKAFFSLNFDHDTMEFGNLYETAVLPSYSELIQYGAVFIVCGNRDRYQEILSSQQINDLTLYLDAGGCVYIEGTNIAEFLNEASQTFLNDYFGNFLSYGGDTSYSGFGMLLSDPESYLFRPYTFIYPDSTVVDISVDELGNYFGLSFPYYISVLNFNTLGKLYKSTASAYTPPETKAYYFPGRTFMQSTPFGALASQDILGVMFPDSIENRSLRNAYLRDILSYFSIGEVLLVKDDNEVSGTEVSLQNSLQRNGIDYTLYEVPAESAGPSFAAMREYCAVIWYTGEAAVPFKAPYDTVNLKLYLNYGGNLILSGENLAQSIGVPGVNIPGTERQFLERWLSVDYISGEFADGEDFTSSENSTFYDNLFSRNISLSLHTASFVDIVRPFMRDTFVDTAYLLGNLKTGEIVGVANTDTTHKSIFFGFPLEYTDEMHLDSLLNVAFTDYFHFDLKFDNMNIYEKQIRHQQTKDVFVSAKAEIHSGYLIVDGLEDASVIDIAGRKIFKITERVTKINKILPNGIFYVIGRQNSKAVSIKIVKL
jgi:hypothetical protein